MTMQAVDYVKIGKKLYKLIDIEKDKQIITCANFIMPEHNGSLTESTGCYRGYTANYYITKNKLYGIKYQEIYYENLSDYKEIKSFKLFIPYTGSCIIANGNGCNSDFISSYIDYIEAFELYFENGILIEKFPLISAIEKMNVLNENDVYNNEMEPYERAVLREYLAREPLKYKYDNSTYKWRNDINKDDEEEYDNEEKTTLENILKKINGA